MRFQDLQIFGNPAAQPIVFAEHAAKPAEDLSSSSGNNKEGALTRNASTAAANVGHLKPEDKHVVVFVHGFQVSDVCPFSCVRDSYVLVSGWLLKKT